MIEIEWIGGDGRMNKKVLLFAMALFALLTFTEMFNDSYFFIILFIAIISFVLKNKFPKKMEKYFLWFFLLSIIYLVFSSPFFLITLILMILYFTNNHPELSELFREVFSEKSKKKGNNDFIIVDFDQSPHIPNKIKKNKWFGKDKQSLESIYSWEDLNYTKLIGNSIFDLANTLLPREQNVILIQQGIGHVKILIPEGTAVSIDFSGLVGKFTLNHSEYQLLNENYKWYSENYLIQERKIKIVVSLLVGELEVIFL